MNPHSTLLSRNIYCIVRLRKCLLANLTTHYTFNHMNGGMSGGMEKADGPDSKSSSPFICGFTPGRTRSFEVQLGSYYIFNMLMHLNWKEVGESDFFRQRRFY